MSNQQKWRIVASKFGAQRKVCEQLSKLNIEHYCPTSKHLKKGFDRSDMFDHTMFDRKVFVKICDSQIVMVKKLSGIQNFVYWLNEPASITGSEVDSLRNFIATHNNILVEKINIKASQKSATFFINAVESPSGKSKQQECSKTLLPSLGVALVAPVMRPLVDLLTVVPSRYSFSKLSTGSYR